MPRHLLLLLPLILPLTLCAQSAAATLSPPHEDSLTARQRLSPILFLARGNEHAAAGRYGEAVLSFQRGLRLAPGNKTLRNNLRFVRAEANVEAFDPPEAAIVRWWRKLGAFVGAGTAYVLALVFWWLAVGGAVFWLLRRREMDERRRFVLLPAAAGCLLVAGLLYALGSSRNAWLTDDRAAVLTAPVADLRVAPGAGATLERTLTHGYDLQVLDERGAFVKVALADGAQGWLPAKAVERVNFLP